VSKERRGEGEEKERKVQKREETRVELSGMEWRRDERKKAGEQIKVERGRE
jgi:hypothetical protein